MTKREGVSIIPPFAERGRRRIYSLQERFVAPLASESIHTDEDWQIHPGARGDKDCQEGDTPQAEGCRVRGDRRQGRVKDLHCENDIKT